MHEIHDIGASDVAGSLQGKSKALVFATSWMPYAAWHSFNQKFAEFRFKNHCWGEFKFDKCTPQYLPYYKQIIKLFFDTKDLNFSSMIVEKSKLKKQVSIDGSAAWQSLRKADDIYSFHVYMHLSRFAFLYCQDHSHLTLLHDTGELQNRIPITVDRINDYFQQQRLKSPAKKLTIDYSCQITSHSLALMQVCDLLAGAIYRKWHSVNDKQSQAEDKAKDELVSFIEEQLKSSYPDVTYRLHKDSNQLAPKLNRWHFQPDPNTYEHLN